MWLLDYYYVYSCSKKFLKVFVVVESLPYLNIYLSIYFFAAIRFLIFSIEFCHFKKIMNWILKNFGALIVILSLMTLSNTFLVHKNSRVNYMCLNFIKAYTFIYNIHEYEHAYITNWSLVIGLISIVK